MRTRVPTVLLVSVRAGRVPSGSHHHAPAGREVVKLLASESHRHVRLLAITAVTLLVRGWGASRYPNPLGTHTTVGSAATPGASLALLLVVVTIAVVVVVPSLALLCRLQHRSQLEG